MAGPAAPGGGGQGPQGATRPAGPAPARPASSPGPDAPAPSADTDRLARETEAARRNFHRAADADPTASGSTDRARRNSALQAFFIANAGRSLLPGHEASGAVTPPLKDEEA
jgi:type IV secretion system protein TrbL